MFGAAWACPPTGSLVFAGARGIAISQCGQRISGGREDGVELWLAAADSDEPLRSHKRVLEAVRGQSAKAVAPPP